MYFREYDDEGMVCRLAWVPDKPKPPAPVYSLTCEQCSGDLLAGRNETVCERGCPIRHKTPLDWLERNHPERKLEHSNFRTLLKDVKEGAQKLMKLDNEQ